MMAHSRVTARRMAATRSRAREGSRYSLRCFIFGLELAEHFKSDTGFVFVDLLESEAGVAEDVVAGFDGGGAVDADASVNAAEADVGFEDAVSRVGAEDFSGD